MKEIFKTLIKYKYKILLTIVLLVFQAYFDLSLPTYTSNIVNVGLQSSGIESVTPEVIRESKMNELTNLVDLNEKKTLLESYDYIKKDSKKYDYKILKEEGIYVLKEKDKDLSNILLYPMFVTSTNEFDNLFMNDFDLVKVIKEKYSGNEALLEGMIKNNIKEEYEIIGLNTKDLQMSYIYKTGLKMIICALLAMGSTVATVYLASTVSASFARDLRKKVTSKVIDFEPQDLGELSTSSLITRCTNDVNQIQMLVTALLRIVIYAPILGVGAIMKVRGYTIGWVIVVSVVAILTLILTLFILVVPKFKKFQDLLDRLNLVSRESLNGISVIRAFANYKEEERRFDEANSNLTKNGLFVGRAMAFMSPTLTFLMNSVAILVIWVGAKEVNNFNMQVGDVIAFITYTMQIIMAFLMISVMSIMLPRAIVSLKRLAFIFNKEKTIKEKENAKKFNSNEHYVEFKDVYFRYPDATEDVLSNISFIAKKGTTTAFIGSTGSGKSTLINLIPRFFDVTSGKIIIDNQDIRDVKLKDLRKKISYVPQKGRLFKGTILSNLELAQDKKDRNKIDEALKLSESLEILKEDINGINREISEGGTNVSGGQRQRLSIARALSKDSEILIFDDSFSALDFKTDARVRKSLRKVTKDKIVFIVAQRISSIMNADNIIVLDEGNVVGMGTHDELIKTCEIYKQIASSQLGGLKDA